MESTVEPFLDLSARFLEEDFLPRIRACLESLEPGDVWWSPNPASNSVGNLVLHLEGNLRQWVASGVGGGTDVRRRDEEFQGDRHLTADELGRNLERAVEEAVAVLRETDPERLGEEVTIQGMEVTVREAVYHAVEHFSMHTGQIIYATKLRKAADLGFYRIGGDGTAERAWLDDAGGGP